MRFGKPDNNILRRKRRERGEFVNPPEGILAQRSNDGVFRR